MRLALFLATLALAGCGSVGPTEIRTDAGMDTSVEDSEPPPETITTWRKNVGGSLTAMAMDGHDVLVGARGIDGNVFVVRVAADGIMHRSPSFAARTIEGIAVRPDGRIALAAHDLADGIVVTMTPTFEQISRTILDGPSHLQDVPVVAAFERDGALWIGGHSEGPTLWKLDDKGEVLASRRLTDGTESDYVWSLTTGPTHEMLGGIVRGSGAGGALWTVGTDAETLDLTELPLQPLGFRQLADGRQSYCADGYGIAMVVDGGVRIGPPPGPVNPAYRSCSLFASGGGAELGYSHDSLSLVVLRPDFSPRLRASPAMDARRVVADGEDLLYLGAPDGTIARIELEVP